MDVLSVAVVLPHFNESLDVLAVDILADDGKLGGFERGGPILRFVAECRLLGMGGEDERHDSNR